MISWIPSNKETMNILFLLRLWPVYGGGETVTICLANEMVRRGYNCTVAYFKDNVRSALPHIDERIKTCKIDGIDCDEFHANDDDSEKVIKYLVECVEKDAIDIIINQWWPVSYIRGVKDSCNVKVIKCLHTAFYRLPIDDPNPLRRLVKKAVKPWYVKRTKQLAIQAVMSYLPYVDKYVFLSPRFQKDFQETAGFVVPGNILASIPNPTVFSCSFDMDNYSKKEKIVLLVGRMVDPPKKITRAIEVWRNIEADERYREWKFVLVGDGPDLPMYKRMSVKYGLKRIFFAGYQIPDSYYKRSRIFLMTSDFEGFGMTLVESHQNAVVPIVMDSFLSLHDIVEDNVNGLIVRNHDIAGYTNALKQLMADEKLCRQLAEKGLETCQRFQVARVVDQWEQLICGLNRSPDKQ